MKKTHSKKSTKRQLSKNDNITDFVITDPNTLRMPNTFFNFLPLDIIIYMKSFIHFNNWKFVKDTYQLTKYNNIVLQDIDNKPDFLRNNMIRIQIQKKYPYQLVYVLVKKNSNIVSCIFPAKLNHVILIRSLAPKYLEILTHLFPEQTILQVVAE